MRVTLPAPVLKAFNWRVIASGAGASVDAEIDTRSLPVGFVVVASVFVAAVVAMLGRMARRRRQRRRENVRGADHASRVGHRTVVRPFAWRSSSLKDAATLGP